MDNYPTMFQSSSSSTPQMMNPHPALLTNMVNPAVHHHHQAQLLLDQYCNPSTYLHTDSDDINKMGINIPRSSDVSQSILDHQLQAKPGSGKNSTTSKCGGGEKKSSSRKQPKYAFQTRSQVDILDDGYRWRKYGQKSVKNNKFPRSYYRCTYQGCNVKKQIQRLSKEEDVVVTTYEGMHSHPIHKSTHDNFEHILTQMRIYTTSF